MPGHCDNCEEDRLAKIRHGEELMRASMKKVTSAAVAVEMPTMSDEVQEQLGLDQEDERERYP